MGICCSCCSNGKIEQNEMEGAKFFDTFKGEEIEISNDGLVVSGNGVCFVNASLQQDRCYYEICLEKLDSSESHFAIGISQLGKMSEFPDKQRSWALESSTSTESFKTGDVIGCAFDQSEGRPIMKFYLNGTVFPPGTELRGIRGTVNPCIKISRGIVVRGHFPVEDGDFKFQPPRNFPGLIPARSVV